MEGRWVYSVVIHVYTRSFYAIEWGVTEYTVLLYTCTLVILLNGGSLSVQCCYTCAYLFCYWMGDHWVYSVVIHVYTCYAIEWGITECTVLSYMCTLVLLLNGGHWVWQCAFIVHQTCSLRTRKYRWQLVCTTFRTNQSHLSCSCAQQGNSYRLQRNLSYQE